MAKRIYTIQLEVNDDAINDGIADDGQRFGARVQGALDAAWPGAPIRSLDVRSIVGANQVIYSGPTGRKAESES